MLGSLSLVDEHHGCGLVDGNLAHHLAADGACAARDEDATARELVAHRLHVDDDFLAGQQVFHAHFLHLGHLLGRCIDIPLLHVLHHIDFHARIDEKVLQSLVVAELIVAQGRNEHCLYA